jgi:hypothetical protein
MTEEEAWKTLQAKFSHIGGDLETRIIPYECTGGYAVISPVDDFPDLWFILTEYDQNIFEALGTIASVPPVVKLAPAAVNSSPPTS